MDTNTLGVPRDDFRVLHWTDESVPEILDLTRATLGDGGAVSKTEDFWRWKHCNNPFGRSYGICAVDDASSRAAALRVLLRWKFRSPTGGVLRAARAVDTATHPDFQRRGLFSRLTKQAIAELREDGTDLIFNTPNDNSLPGYLKMGWTLIDKRRIYIRPLRPARMVRRRLGLADRPEAAEPSAYFEESSTMPWHSFINTYGDEVWRLMGKWEDRRKAVGWRTARSRAYYAWRYGQHPHVTYYVHVLREPNDAVRTLSGYAVLRANVRRGWQEVVLCELVLAEASVESGHRLLRSLAETVEADYIAAHFAPGTVEYRCIRSSGYHSVPRQGMRFTVRPLSDTVVDVERPAAWDLSLGDLEIF